MQSPEVEWWRRNIPDGTITLRIKLDNSKAINSLQIFDVQAKEEYKPKKKGITSRRFAENTLN